MHLSCVEVIDFVYTQSVGNNLQHSPVRGGIATTLQLELFQVLYIYNYVYILGKHHGEYKTSQYTPLKAQLSSRD